MAVRTFTGKDVKDTSPENYQVTWEGRVLATGEHNGYDDSDFYAVVWDDEQGAPREVTYASTRGWTYNNSATVDADDATRAKYDAYRERQRASLEAVTVRVGKTVRVARGRSVPVGTTGKVFWYGPGRKRYAYDRNPGYRVGLRTEDGEKFFTDARNVEVAA